MARHILMYSESVSLFHLTKLLKIADIIQTHAPEIQITFVCGQDKIKLVEAKGFEARPVFVANPPVLYGRLVDLKPMYDYQTLEKYLDEDLKTVESIKPDLILYDMRLSIPVVSQLTEIPVVPVISALWIPQYRGKRSVPFQMKKIPFSGLLFESPLGRIFEKKFIDESSRPLQRLSRKVGLNSLPTFQDYASFGQNVILPDLPEMVGLSLPPTPPKLHLAGPLLWSFPGTLPEELNRIDRKKDRLPTIYFSLGTSAFPVENAIPLVENLLSQNYRIILQKGGRVIPHLIQHPNLYVYDFLPNLEVLKKVNLIISHGGIATSYEALSCGVPILGIPSFPDQQWHMDQVVAQGAGKMIFPDEVMTTKMIKTIRELIENPAYQNNAKRLKAAIESYPTEEKVLQALEIRVTKLLRVKKSDE